MRWAGDRKMGKINKNGVEMRGPPMRGITVALVMTAMFGSASAQARFLQTDPVGYTADLNLYTYVGNDPTE